MKNPLQLAINAVLLIAVAVLYFLHFSGRPATRAAVSKPAAAVVTSDSTAAPVAEEPVADVEDTATATPAAVPASVTAADKIAYVESGKLLDGYQGMKDAKRAFETKARGWQKQSESIQNGFKSAVESYQKGAGTMTAEQRASTEQRLEQQEQQIRQQLAGLQTQAQEEEAKLTSTVLGRINKQVEAYGKANGYKLILIAAPSGTIAYGRKDLDITTPVLGYLNSEYRKK